MHCLCELSRITKISCTVYARYTGDASYGESRYNGDFLGDDYQKWFLCSEFEYE